MSSDDPELSVLVGDLSDIVEELQSELKSNQGQPRAPTPRQLAEFTSEVTIPGIILVLETNVRALRLFQRTLRHAEGRSGGGAETQARKRVSDLGRTTLSRLDDALMDLGSALDDSRGTGDARDLLEDVRDLQSDIDARLDTVAGPASDDDDPDGVDVDVDAELQSLKNDAEGDNSHDGNDSND